MSSPLRTQLAALIQSYASGVLTPTEYRRSLCEALSTWACRDDLDDLTLALSDAIGLAQMLRRPA